MSIYCPLAKALDIETSMSITDIDVDDISQEIVNVTEKRHPEIKKAISESLKGKPKSKEHRKALSDAAIKRIERDGPRMDLRKNFTTKGRKLSTVSQKASERQKDREHNTWVSHIKLEAKKRGDTFYYTGKICKNGHDDVRYVIGGLCRTCKRELNKQF